MPPKRSKISPKSLKSATAAQPVEKKNNALSNMFKRIESLDSASKSCPQCNETVKSCLLSDHLQTKCVNRKKTDTKSSPKADLASVQNEHEDNDDVLILEELSSNKRTSARTGSTTRRNQISASTDSNISKPPKKELYKEEVPITNPETISSHNNLVSQTKENMGNQPVIKSESVIFEEEVLLTENTTKRHKPDQVVEVEESSSQIMNEFMSLIDTGNLEPIKVADQPIEKQICSEQVIETEMVQVKAEPGEEKIDYYLVNFMNALEAVLSEKTFSCLLDPLDYETIDRFSSLSINSKKLFVRLFQRKHNWLKPALINYEHIAADLTCHMSELATNKFLIDESTIDTYEEIIGLFRLPELKDLAKQFHILNPAQTVKLRSDLVKTILQHFKTQKGLQFGGAKSTQPAGGINQKFMTQCKKLLGKCYKLDTESRGVFVRILMLYNLSSTYHSDANGTESGQKQL